MKIIGPWGVGKKRGGHSFEVIVKSNAEKRQRSFTVTSASLEKLYNEIWFHIKHQEEK